jgi:hypothetical protein
VLTAAPAATHRPARLSNYWQGGNVQLTAHAHASMGWQGMPLAHSAPSHGISLPLSLLSCCPCLPDPHHRVRSYHSSSNLAAELAAEQQLTGLSDGVLGSPVGAVHPVTQRDTSSGGSAAAAAAAGEADPPQQQQQQQQQPAMSRPHHVSFVDEVVGGSGSSSPRFPSSSTHTAAGYDSAPGSQQVSLDGKGGSEGGAAAAGGTRPGSAGVRRGSSFSALSGAVSHMGAPPVLAGPGSGRFSATAADTGVSGGVSVGFCGSSLHILYSCIFCFAINSAAAAMRSQHLMTADTVSTTLLALSTCCSCLLLVAAAALQMCWSGSAPVHAAGVVTWRLAC